MTSSAQVKQFFRNLNCQQKSLPAQMKLQLRSLIPQQMMCFTQVKLLFRNHDCQLTSSPTHMKLHLKSLKPRRMSLPSIFNYQLNVLLSLRSGLLRLTERNGSSKGVVKIGL